MAANDTSRTLTVGPKIYAYYSLADAGFDVAALPVSLKILGENLLRNHDGVTVTDAHIASLANWTVTRSLAGEVPFFPLRILMPDSSGIPLLADLAAMRDAVARHGGDPARVKPLIPLDLIVDHSVIVEATGTADAAEKNIALEFERNQERYAFLRWAQASFEGLKVVPPGNGICHQINLEKLASVVQVVARNGESLACPDTLVGMDSHTAMINALSVLGWGVGGIEAATAMLGEPLGVQVPSVVGCRLVGRLPTGVTTTDLVLSVTQRLRQHGVLGAFVEFCGEGVAALALTERATLSNMCPEYGATIALFPIDAQTIRYLSLTGREGAHVALVEAYAKAQGLWRDAAREPTFNEVVEIDLGAIVPSAAGPRRPHERLALEAVPASFAKAVNGRARKKNGALADGDVVIAAITSCTNTSNPSVMVAAGLLARNAVQRGLRKQAWVKASLAPGSRVVADYLDRTGLQAALDALGFNIAGYGCTTCMGNSGSLAPDIAADIASNDLTVAAVLSGNRNFESRIHPLAKTNYLVSPPLVVAYAIAGSVCADLTREPLGIGSDGAPVFLRDVWPDDGEVRDVIERTIDRAMYRSRYAEGFAGSERWERLPYAKSVRFSWELSSTHIKPPPFFDGFSEAPVPLADIVGARALAVLGDGVTTDHISPIGVIPPESDAGEYLGAHQVSARKLGSYMERRVNHDVMVRGTFANLELQNEMASRRGSLTRHIPSGAEMTIHAAAQRYAHEGTPVIIVAGREYGAGSSRDWAAKGTRLLGIRAILAESFERIHRSNLIGMGVLPLQFADGVTRASLKLDGRERFDIIGLAAELRPNANVTKANVAKANVTKANVTKANVTKANITKANITKANITKDNITKDNITKDNITKRNVACRVTGPDGRIQEISLTIRLDTEREVDWYRHGGVLTYALRRLMAA